MYRDTKELADLPAASLAVVRDVAIPGPAGPIPARLFDGRGDRGAGPLVLFFHGGGFVIGDLDTHAGLCAEIALALDLPVLAVDYRLAPEHPWPAAPDDAEAAARWAAGQPDVTGLVLCGDSAGGALSIVTAAALRDRPAAAPVLAQALLYPAADLGDAHPSFDLYADGYLLTRDAMAWFGAAYAADAGHVRGSPLRGRLDGMPPAVILTAELDPIRDQGRAYAAALIAAGVPVTYREARGTIHGFATLRRAIPSAVGDVADFLRATGLAVAEATA